VAHNGHRLPRAEGSRERVRNICANALQWRMPSGGARRVLQGDGGKDSTRGTAHRRSARPFAPP